MLPAATFGQAWSSFTSQLFVFSKHSTRAEYWWIVLLYIGVNLTLSVIQTVLDFAAPDTITPVFSLFSYLLSQVVFILTLGLTVRRFHDAGFATWVFIVTLIVPATLALFGLMLALALFLFDATSGLFHNADSWAGWLIVIALFVVALAIYAPPSSSGRGDE